MYYFVAREYGRRGGIYNPRNQTSSSLIIRVGSKVMPLLAWVFVRMYNFIYHAVRSN